uniref:Uncharacterized protein n=1 Tax=Hucho hucho TaxID=62062 RepID=A0A4W5REU8_9TELE
MKRLLGLPTWVLLDDAIRMFFYQTESDSQYQPRALRRLRPPTRRVKTVKTNQTDVFSSPRAEVGLQYYSLSFFLFLSFSSSSSSPELR